MRTTQLIETVNFPFMPVLISIVCTCGLLMPRVPAYVCILLVLLAVYATVSYLMYKRILGLNEKAAGAQNQLSGELSDSVANILAVKTYGREDYERSLFDDANREVVKRDTTRMMSSLARGIITACITIVIMAIVTVFIAGGNACVRDHAGHACHDVHVHCTPSRTSSTSSTTACSVSTARSAMRPA